VKHFVAATAHRERPHSPRGQPRDAGRGQGERGTPYQSVEPPSGPAQEGTAPICNAMTVDVEDYFHVSAFARRIQRSEWDRFAPRVEANTQRLLDLFDEYRVRATFFVLGWVAERCPGLVREIAGRGHEVACHGYSHELVYNQTRDAFQAETARTKACLEDQAQSPVIGYRAASYSIVRSSLWALEVLVDLGFLYDSSIFPVRHDLYGIPGSPRWPYRLATANGSISEFPPSTTMLLGQPLPVGGGGYFRLYPYWLTRRALEGINHVDKQPFMFYLHPWEVDPEQPRIRAGALSTLRHYTNLRRCEGRLRRLMEAFRFATAREVLAGLTLADGAPDAS
jgi:polysaccharide deacetylase family protein (PEP-CTERM system associated)